MELLDQANELLANPPGGDSSQIRPELDALYEQAEGIEKIFIGQLYEALRLREGIDGPSD